MYHIINQISKHSDPLASSVCFVTPQPNIEHARGSWRPY